MCVDYTDLNKHCPKDPFGLPHIDQVIDSTAGCTYPTVSDHTSEDTPVRPGAAGLLTGVECSRVRDSSWMDLTSFVTTQIGVELAVVRGNYTTRL